MKRLSRFMLVPSVLATCGHLPVAATPHLLRDGLLYAIPVPVAQTSTAGWNGPAPDSDGTAACPGSTERTTPSSAASITLPSGPVPFGAWVGISAAFDAAHPGDPQSATIEWGDGSTSELNVSGGPLSGSHRYATGIYTVAVRVGKGERSDSRSSPAEQTSYVVVYDPSATSVTGNGWIRSEAGWHTVADACKVDNRLARFGFVFGYQKGLSAPVGYAGFHFEDGAFRFRSVGHDWLSVSGATAQFRGRGWVNDVAGYGFLLTVHDGDGERGKDRRVDRMRIRIWEKDSGRVVYDNRRATIAGGTITIR